jgi:hypothetical protein
MPCFVQLTLSGPPIWLHLSHVYARASGRLALARETMKPSNYPRPTNGILVAIIVINSTLASNGRFAM